MKGENRLETLLASELGTNLFLSENRLQTVFLLKDRLIPTLEKMRGKKDPIHKRVKGATSGVKRYIDPLLWGRYDQTGGHFVWRSFSPQS